MGTLIIHPVSGENDAYGDFYDGTDPFWQNCGFYMMRQRPLAGCKLPWFVLRCTSNNKFNLIIILIIYNFNHYLFMIELRGNFNHYLLLFIRSGRGFLYAPSSFMFGNKRMC